MTLILGLGHPARGDDAAGLLVAERITAMAPLGVVARAHQGDGADLMEAWAGAETVYLVDTVVSGVPPGTIHRFAAHEAPLPAAAEHRSSHTFSIPQAIELARALGRLPPRLFVVGIEGADFSPGTPLSPEVAAGVETVTRCLLDEVGQRS